MGATYEVPYSNSNDAGEFSWRWNVPASVYKMFPLCLKMLFHFKSRRVFLAHRVLKLQILIKEFQF
jgi:hypothetical protein